MGRKGYREQGLWLPLALVGDGLVIGGSFPLAYWLRAAAPNQLLPLDVYLGLGVVCMLAYWAVSGGLGSYRESKRLSRFDELLTALTSLVLALGVVLAGVFFVRSISLSRLVIAYAGFLGAGGLLAIRLGLRGLFSWLRAQGFGIHRVLWVGQNPMLADVLDRLNYRPQLGFRVVGQVLPVGVDPIPLTEGMQPPALVECVENLSHYLQTHPEIDEIWFAQPELATAEVLLGLQYRHRPDLQIRLVPDILSVLTARLTLRSLDGIPLLTLQDPPLRHWYNRVLKRSLDIAGSTVGLMVLGPILLGIALGVKLSSPGPIFYLQERISLDGHPFWIYKFRSMRVNAESNHQPGWTTPEDPRRTLFGSFLRRTNLDELPQLWNVLRGDMSLVGPRPERPYYVEQFSRDIPKYLDRHLTKTGMTGWAQVNGWRGDTSIARRTQYDLYYIQNWSLLLDFRIISMTVWQSLTGQAGGY